MFLALVTTKEPLWWEENAFSVEMERKVVDSGFQLCSSSTVKGIFRINLISEAARSQNEFPLSSFHSTRCKDVRPQALLHGAWKSYSSLHGIRMFLFWSRFCCLLLPKRIRCSARTRRECTRTEHDLNNGPTFCELPFPIEERSVCFFFYECLVKSKFTLMICIMLLCFLRRHACRGVSSSCSLCSYETNLNLGRTRKEVSPVEHARPQLQTVHSTVAVVERPLLTTPGGGGWITTKETSLVVTLFSTDSNKGLFLLCSCHVEGAHQVNRIWLLLLWKFVFQKPQQLIC